ncbi:MAG: hypothetical protein M1343_12180 [Chloroflexi bacterium]|nr:hypothetical protein [Chloroflexota bacterium]
MRIHTLSIDGDLVGIIGMGEIVAEVKALGLKQEGEIKEELLTRVQRRNHVARGSEEGYRKALWGEYLGRQ